MSNKLDLTIILPIKSSLAKDFDEYFTKAIESIKNQKVQVQELLIVATVEEQLKSYLESYDFGELNVRTVVWNKEPSYSTQVNFGVEQSTTKWVSLFEFDDEYANIWFDNVQKYIEFFPEVQAFLPVVVDTDEKGIFAGFTNEAVFAANFSQEMGILTNDVLQDYQNFQTSGMVFRKSIYEDFGGFKSSIKLTFVYEFLLRLTYNSVNIMTIPRLGYKHTNMREGSVFWNYKFGAERMVDDEVKFWIQTAKKEYFFRDDRTINYTSENV
jgi:glycosyltransferase involved in cell wall biosynthesis